MSDFYSASDSLRNKMRKAIIHDFMFEEVPGWLRQDVGCIQCREQSSHRKMYCDRPIPDANTMEELFHQKIYYMQGVLCSWHLLHDYWDDRLIS